MPTGVIFLLVLSALVLIHELGHFLAARTLGIKVEEFALGLPFTKAIFKIKRGETQYGVYPVLFGGFVRLQGEEGPSFAPMSIGASEGKTRDFWERGKKQRMMVIGAGVVMNIALAVAAFIVLYAVVGVPGGERQKATVAKAEE